MNALHEIARRERLVLLGGALLVTLLAWVELWRRAAPMDMMMDGMMRPHDAGSATLMWFVMMVAMMLPSAVPALLIFHAAQKGRLARRPLLALTTLFGAGYLAVWLGWSVVAALLQGQLQHHALLSADLAAASPLLGASILVVAGVYQFTPWKRACLDRCQAPQDFLVLHWRNGWSGTLAMGGHHGLYCVGCCWALMAVLFAVGIMNLVWVAALGAVVLVEKALARGLWASRISGVVLLAWGFSLAYAGLAG